MKRREFIAGLGSAAAWPVVARGQQQALPVVGFLSSLSSQDMTLVIPAFHDGLKQMGYVEGRDTKIEYRWADGHYERLPGLASNLVQHQVAVVAAIRWHPSGAGREGSDDDDTNRICHRWRPCCSWASHQLEPVGG